MASLLLAVVYCHYSNGCVGGPLNGYGLFGEWRDRKWQIIFMW